MSCKYTIIQYVPNIIANERMNIGVLIFNDEDIKVSFIKDWYRVEVFGMEDIQYLLPKG